MLRQVSQFPPSLMLRSRPGVVGAQMKSLGERFVLLVLGMRARVSLLLSFRHGFHNGMFCSL